MSVEMMLRAGGRISVTVIARNILDSYGMTGEQSPVPKLIVTRSN